MRSPTSASENRAYGAEKIGIESILRTSLTQISRSLKRPFGELRL